MCVYVCARTSYAQREDSALEQREPQLDRHLCRFPIQGTLFSIYASWEELGRRLGSESNPASALCGCEACAHA